MKSKKIEGLQRTHHCGELAKGNIGGEVTLCGWVNKCRDLGGLFFIDIRDRFGMTQLSFAHFSQSQKLLDEISLESVIKVKGVVGARPEEAINTKMQTGEIEVLVETLEILSRAQELPFLPSAQTQATEDLRLRYRYLDLRNSHLQEIIQLRSKAYQVTRNALYPLNFTEVETPILYKATPEGARDYLVPSRVHKGKFYALPQSPQTLKQLLMIANTDKYFQICRCFRDEDLRADRQPEFTQLDIEVSFATEEYIKNLSEYLIKKWFKLSDDFQLRVMSYQEAMRDYGSDKPDLRFGLKHHSITQIFQESAFKTFSDIAKQGGLIKGIFVAKNDGELTRKMIDSLVDIIKPYGGKGVAWFKREGKKISGGISKFISPQIQKELDKKVDGQDGLWLFVADPRQEVVHDCADALRRHLGLQLELISQDDYAFAWINEFPLLEYDESAERFYACHHPFTSPHLEDGDDFLSQDREILSQVRAQAYDVVCNGYEIGGGSLRIYNQAVQEQMFKVLGMSSEQTQAQFGFFLEALKYGTPPHAGIAFGFDRLVMLLAKTDNIRDAIAFPKTTSASDLMANAPSLAEQGQLKELGIMPIS